MQLDEPTERLLAIAAYRHRAGRPGLAADAYARVLQACPDHPEALGGLAELRRSQGRPEAALPLCTQGLARHPDHAGLHLVQGLCLGDLGELEQAEERLRQAMALAPADPRPWQPLAVILLYLGRAAEAVPLCRQAVDEAPDDAGAWQALAMALEQAGEVEEARAAMARTVALRPEDDPAAGRELADRVRGRYDGSALYYEARVVPALRNRTPELLQDLLRRHVPAGRRFAEALDLGCGTGLMGARLRPLAARLTGIDLSPRMLDQARRKGIYDRLEVADIVDFLAAGRQPLDLIAASDMLIHLGDLRPAMAAAAARLRPGGLFLLSTEKGRGESWEAIPSGRFRHATAYVERLAGACGLAVRGREAAAIRFDQARPVTGDLWLLERGRGAPAAPVGAEDDPLARPPGPELLRVLAEQRAGRLEAAAAGYERLLARDPENLGALLNLGVVRRRQGRLDEAVALYERGLALAPRAAAFHRNLGNVLFDRDDTAGAARHLGRAVELAPATAIILERLGEALIRQGRGLESELACRRALALDPDRAQARRLLGAALEQLGETGTAIAVYREVLARNPADETIQLRLAALEGRRPGTMPPGRVRRGFDSYADSFEESLVGKLHYRTPELLLDLLHRHVPANRRFAEALDLGCGTGLMGVLLRPLVDRLTGVDLAPRMLARAQDKNVYDALEEAEIVAFLERDTRAYDLVVAADVLIYIGDLAPLLAALAARSRPGALVLLSTEALAEGDWDLGVLTMRFRHAAAYLASQAAAAGFAVLAQETAVIREESDEPVVGGLHLLRKNEP